MQSIKKQLEPTAFKAIELNQSKGILDDYAVRKTIDTKEIYTEKVISRNALAITAENDAITINSVGNTNLTGGDLTFAAGVNMITNAGASAGTKICTSASQKLAFWNATPVAQQGTAGGAATFAVNVGTAVNTGSTFDGYTLVRIVKILRDIGILT